MFGGGLLDFEERILKQDWDTQSFSYRKPDSTVLGGILARTPTIELGSAKDNRVLEECMCI